MLVSIMAQDGIEERAQIHQVQKRPLRKTAVFTICVLRVIRIIVGWQPGGPKLGVVNRRARHRPHVGALRVVETPCIISSA